MEIAPLIDVDPAIHHGAPVIRGTRVPASIVVGSLAGGMTIEQVMAEYSLSKVQIEAALRYAAELVAQVGAVSLSGS
jgi:uncharacterized protein (DUF433 family)